MPYRSVKAALVPFMKSLAIGGAPKGVRANMVSPGSIIEDGNTWGRQREENNERYQRTLSRNPMGRLNPGTDALLRAAIRDRDGASVPLGLDRDASAVMSHRNGRRERRGFARRVHQ